MKEFAHKRTSREALKHRQVEIQQCLAEFGLWRGARCLLRNARPAHEQATHCERLRASLIKLGPVFSSFGIYLSSRVDLLPASYCLELSTIPDRGPATPIVAVRELLTREIGCSPDEAYFAFEDEPFESRLLFQSHRAWLSQVEPVTVKVIHCELEEYLTFDVGLLALVRSVFDGTGLTKSQIASAVGDFRSTLEREINFVGEASALEQYCQDSKGFEMLKAPTVHLPLCSANVLTIERLPGIGLDNILSSLRKQRTEENRLVSDDFEASGLDPANVAHNLYIVWLRQALMGPSFPVAPRAENILVLPTRQIAFTGGLWSSLPSTAQAQIYNYLVAVATEDTDRACSCLLKETNKEKGACSEDDLLHRFRQVVPFRDGGWSNEGNSDTLVEHLFLHWRLASRHGYSPQVHLISFNRGLFMISALARQLAPERDLLKEAVDAFRLMSALEQFQQMMGLQPMGENLNRYAVMLADFPQKLDQMLTVAADGDARMKLHIAETDPRPRQKNSSTATTATLMVLTALVLLANRLATSSVGGVWVDQISGIAFVLISALLLRLVRRTV